MTANETIRYQVHLAKYGWRQMPVSNGIATGTVGHSLQIEAIIVYNLPTGFQYRAHVAERGWLDWVNSGEIAGTIGQSRQLEALQFRDPLGLAANITSVVMGRAHIRYKGWQDIGSAMEPNFLGTTGQALRMEAIQLWLITSLKNLVVKGSRSISVSPQWN